MLDEALPEKIVENKEVVKLNKMSKGYNWEIKIFLDSNDNLDLARLEKIDKHLQDKYGGFS